MIEKENIRIGDFIVSLKGNQLIIDISQSPAPSVFKILSFLSRINEDQISVSSNEIAHPPLSNHSNDSESAKPSSTMKEIVKTKKPRLKKKKVFKRQRLSQDHPKILKARKLVQEGNMSALAICESVGISAPSFYRYTKGLKNSNAKKPISVEE